MPKTATPRGLEGYYFEDPDGNSWYVHVRPEWDEITKKRAAKRALDTGAAVRVRRTQAWEDTTPIKVDPIYPPSEDYRSLQPDTVAPPLNHDVIEYGKRGVLTGKSTKDFSFEEYTKIGTTTNPDEKALAIGALAKQKFGVGKTDSGHEITPNDLVRRVDDDILYLDMKTDKNPKGTNRWVKFEDSMKSPWGVGKGAAAIGGYALGFTPGALMGNPVAAHLGGAAASGIASGAVERWRTQRGIDQGVSDPSFTNPNMAALKEAGMVAGTTLVGDALVAKMNRPGRINNYYFDPGYERQMKEGLAEYDAVKARIDALNKEKFGPDAPELDISAAKASGVPELLNLEATITAKQSTKQAEGLSERLLKMQNNAIRTVNDALDHILGRNSADVYDIGTKVKGAVPGVDTDPAYIAAQRARQTAEYPMKQIDAGIPSKEMVPTSAVMREVRGSADDVSNLRGIEGQRFRDEAAEQEAWDQVDAALQVSYRKRQPPAAPPPAPKMSTVLGPDGRPIPLPSKPPPPAKPGFPDYEKTSPITLVIKPDNPHMDKLARSWADVRDVLFQPGGAEQQFGAQMDTIISAIQKGEPIQLSTLMNGIKQLRQIERQNVSRSGPYKVDTKFLFDIEKALVGVRDDFIKNNAPDVGAALGRAEGLSREVTDNYYRTILKDFTALRAANPDNPMVLPDELLGKIMTPGDGRAAEVVVTALRGDPKALEALRMGIMREYRDKVYQNGVVNPLEHKRFMDNYKQVLQRVVDPRDLRKLEALGGAAHALQASIQRQELAEKAFLKTYAGKIGKYSAEDITQSLFRTNKLNVAEVANLTEFLRMNNPELLAEVRLGIGAEIKKQLTVGTGDLSRVLPDTIRTLTSGSRAAKMSMIMGKQYVDDLMTVQKALNMLARSGDPINIPASTPTLAMFRVIWGPLSRTQRFISAAKQYEIAGYEKTLFNILTNPEKLRLAVKYGNVPVNSDVIAPILSILGIQFVDNDDKTVTFKAPPVRVHQEGVQPAAY